MRKVKTSHVLMGVLLVFITSFSPSCASANKSKSYTQRQGLMMQDKADYSRNRVHFKGSKSYKKQAKRNMRYKKNRMKQRRR